MRLKGGKVLIDLSSIDISSEPEVTLSDEEIKAILDKGVRIYLYDGTNGYKFLHEVKYNILGETSLRESGAFEDSNENIYDVLLNLSGKSLSLLIQ